MESNRICDGNKPLRPKWITVRSQWSFAWLSSEENISMNDASRETAHRNAQSFHKKPPKTTAVHCASPLNCHYPFSCMFNHCVTARASIKGQKTSENTTMRLLSWCYGSVLSVWWGRWLWAPWLISRLYKIMLTGGLARGFMRRGKKRRPGSPEGLLSCSWCWQCLMYGL